MKILTGRVVLASLIFAVIAFAVHRYANASAIIVGDQRCYFYYALEKESGVKTLCAPGRTLAATPIQDADRVFLLYDYAEPLELDKTLRETKGVVFCVLPESEPGRTVMQKLCLHTIEPSSINRLSGMIRRRAE